MATATAPQSFQSSQLSRDARTVFAAAELAPVTITRRDGDPLTLMPSRSLEAEAELHTLASTLIAAMRETSSRPLHERLADALTWMHALDDNDQSACAAELQKTVIAALATSSPRRALEALASWRGTAEAIADGLTANSVEWLDSDVVAERP